MARAAAAVALTLWLRETFSTRDRRLRRRRLALLGLGALMAWSVFGGNQGLVSLAFSWRESWVLKREIVRLTEENLALRARQISIARDRAYYEALAREKLHLRYPGEVVYRFEGQAPSR